MQQPQVLIRCLVFTTTALVSLCFHPLGTGLTVTDQRWATQKSIGLNHGLSSFSTSTLQNLGIPHLCRLFEHRAKPMSFPYEWGDAVNIGENSTGDHKCTFGSKFWASQIPSWYSFFVLGRCSSQISIFLVDVFADAFPTLLSINRHMFFVLHMMVVTK